MVLQDCRGERYEQGRGRARRHRHPELNAEIARIAENQSKLRPEIDAIVADLEGQR